MAGCGSFGSPSIRQGEIEGTFMCAACGAVLNPKEKDERGLMKRIDNSYEVTNGKLVKCSCCGNPKISVKRANKEG